jgi:ligand-binding sensor domain-containing protein/serine phosphatase RsbU (regulator of sigma subunit)
MNYSRRRLGKIMPILIFLLSNCFLNAQEYNFENYNVEEGICHPFVYNVIQDNDGYLWLGTGAGICRFNGLEFTSIADTDSITSAYVTCSFKDSEGNLWFGHNDGNITLYDGKSFQPVIIEQKRIPLVKSAINGITETSGGRVIAASQNDGFFEILEDLNLSGFEGELEGTLNFTLLALENNLLLTGTSQGIVLYQINENLTLEILSHPEDFAYSKVNTINRGNGDGYFWMGTGDMGAYRFMISPDHALDFEAVGHQFGLEYSDVQDIYEDENKDLWLSTFGEGAYKLVFDSISGSYEKSVHFSEENGLGSMFVKTIYEDAAGNIWAATYGNGLSVLLNEAFVTYDFEEIGFSKSIYSMAIEDSLYWLGGDGAILRYNINSPDKYQIIDKGLPNDAITALYIASDKKIHVGTGRNGLYTLSLPGMQVSRAHVSQNSLENMVNSITGNKATIWVATNNGVLSIDRESGEKTRYSTNEGLPHNKIRQVFIDSQGIVWIASRSNSLFAINKEIKHTIQENMVLEFTSITEDEKGNLWAGTNGDGVFRFDTDTLVYISEENGLATNYCYAIQSDNNGSVWVGHRLAMSRITTSDYLINRYGTEVGISGDIHYNAMVRSDEGKVLAGTTDGLVEYDPASDDRDFVAPMLNITSIRVNDEPIDLSDEIILPYNKYKIRIEFIGLYYQDPGAVKYQYKMKDDPEWSELSSTDYALYGRLTDGEYTFMLRACVDGGICTEEPLTLFIKIKKPFWKTWWFIVLVILLLIFSVYIIIKIRERKQKQFQEFLQQKLDERTKEVVEQKQEIENKNRDITDSINYAQRIQSSILPSIKNLQSNFSGSFVYYLPRDIVSGDFYWFDKISDNKFVIVCADSTGHGVPGAFMSMIGTTLIKDICMRPDVNSPSEILTSLDFEIHNTLNQNVDAERSNDGMDIIVCEIDTVTNYMRYASAMRPMIVYHNGEQIYMKGSRSSIGGHRANDEKSFEDEGMQLTKGDLIYMFSDGYPDQFGGPMGKKFKMVRLKNLLKDIHAQPMEVQYEHVKNNFEIWKEGHDQVDDVLFMGIKI